MCNFHGPDIPDSRPEGTKGLCGSWFMVVLEVSRPPNPKTPFFRLLASHDRIVWALINEGLTSVGGGELSTGIKVTLSGPLNQTPSYGYGYLKKTLYVLEIQETLSADIKYTNVRFQSQSKLQPVSARVHCCFSPWPPMDPPSSSRRQLQQRRRW